MSNLDSILKISVVTEDFTFLISNCSNHLSHALSRQSLVALVRSFSLDKFRKLEKAEEHVK